MGDVSHNNSFDEIEVHYQAGTYGSQAHLKAEAALKVKSVIESIELQKKMIKYTNDLVKYQRRTIRASWALAFLTGLLFLSTAVYSIFSYLDYKSSNEQVVAINNMTQAARDQVGQMKNLNTSLNAVNNALSKIPGAIVSSQHLKHDLDKYGKPRLQSNVIEEKAQGLIR